MDAQTLRRSDLFAMLAVVGSVGLVMILWSHVGDELIPVRGGIGYDGTVYSAITKHPIAMIFDHGLDLHRVQRILPSLAVYAMLKPLGLNESNTAIVVGFQILNYLLMAGAALLWWHVSRRLPISRAAGWVGFTALLVNYGLLKFQAYSPTMTDTAGFALGMALVWCVVLKQRDLIPVVAVLGAFTWPTVTYAALLVWVVSREAPPLKPSRVWGVAMAATLALVIPAVGVWAWRCGDTCGSALMHDSVLPALLPISVVVLVAWIYLATRPLLELLTVPNVLRAIDWPRLLLAVVILVGVMLLQRHLAEPSFRTGSRTLFNTALGGIAKPAGFLVAHAVYYGPAVLLLVLTWRRAVAVVREWGAGPVLLTLGFVLLATTNEARILMNEWPWFVLLAAVVVDRLGWQAREAWIFGLLSVIASRLWFPVFHGAYTGDWRAYPDQYYGMSLGLKMTAFSYTMMATCCVIIGFVLFRMVHRPRSRALEPPVPVG